MSTMTMNPGTVVSLPKEGSEHWGKVWGKVKAFFSEVRYAMEPFFGPANLDILEDKYMSGLSPMEQTEIKNAFRI